MFGVIVKNIKKLSKIKIIEIFTYVWCHREKYKKLNIIKNG